MKPMEHNSFFNEAMETINRIQNDNRMLPELNWFLAAAAARFDKHYLESRNPQVIVLGDDIPAEILYAVCDRPFYVLGGSLETAHWADELTPRDTDPFSRSSLGWLLNPAFDLTENALIVTAVSSDSRRIHIECPGPPFLKHIPLELFNSKVSVLVVIYINLFFKHKNQTLKKSMFQGFISCVYFL